MNKKNIIKKAAALALGATLTVGATGCSFVLTDNEKDLAQTIAKVDISEKLAQNEGATSVTDVAGVLKVLSSDITKRDLVATFLTSGYSQAQTYGYATVFNQLLTSLVNREIMIQYAGAYYLNSESGVFTVEGCNKFVKAERKALQDKIDATEGKEEKENLQKELQLLDKHPEVLTLKYFLTDNGTNMQDYNYTVYSLRKSFNDSLDTLEKEYVKAEEKEHDHATAQTLPTGVNVQRDKYYPADANGNINYNVYTGRNLRGDCGEYESIDGSTTATRQKAYNDFLSNLQSYSLVQNKGSEVENTKEAILLDYYYVELSSSLGQALINKYFEDLEDEALALVDEDYAKRKYQETLQEQELNYAKDSDAFATAIGNESATSMTLYGLENFGFVYNILLPFSTEQNEEYARAENAGLTTDQLYNVRKSLLKNVKGKDQRAGWINEHEDENYATKGEDGKYYFFQDILSGESEYETLTHYLGLVPFNGTAESKDEKYEFTWNDVTVDSVVDDFLRLTKDATGCTYTDTHVAAYAEDDMQTKYVKADGEVDYSKFVYRKGKINLGEAKADDYFVESSNLYKMVSVANELMFAYSTDKGCLNTYMGYTVSPYSTQYMKEFEFAAQQAVKDGAGSFYVVPTSYGWHIIITTFTFQGGEVYGGYNHAASEEDGTFSNLFYEYLKTDKIASYTSDKQTKVLNEYNNDDCVTLYKSRYQDLLDM